MQQYLKFDEINNNLVSLKKLSNITLNYYQFKLKLFKKYINFCFFINGNKLLYNKIKFFCNNITIY